MGMLGKNGLWGSNKHAAGDLLTWMGQGQEEVVGG